MPVSSLEAQVLRYAHLVANGVLRGDLQSAVQALGNCTTAVGLYVGLHPEAKKSAAELDAIADQLHSVAAAIEQLEEQLAGSRPRESL